MIAKFLKIMNLGRYISISGLDLAVIRMNIVIQEAEEKHVIMMKATNNNSK